MLKTSCSGREMLRMVKIRIYI